MKSPFLYLASSAALALGALLNFTPSLLTAAEPFAIHVDAAQKGAPISPFIYGQFIEHLGRCIQGGIWAEMLEDRKFLSDAGSADSPWKVVGNPASVRMEAKDAFVNGHSPLITAAPAGNGIRQEGLGVLKGKDYTGRVWLAGDPNLSVEISLAWGDAEQARQMVTIGSLGNAYSKHEFRFTSQADTDNASFSVTAKGSGALRIGAVSLMPADHVNGCRADTLALLKELNGTIYRWPGGNFVSGYDWRDGIGDPDRRPTRKNPAWQGIEPNDFGILEFLDFCREIHTEPLITVNTGFGDAYSAAAEVEYANGSPDTAMGSLRARHGRPEPYKAKYWCVGNEMWGQWQLGHMALSDYILKHNWVASKMREVDPSILLFASGSLETRDKETKQAKKDISWSEGLLRHCSGHMDYLAEHFYVKGIPNVTEHVRLTANHIRSKAIGFRELLAATKMEQTPIHLAMTEWNYWYGGHVFGELGTRYFLKDGLGIAAGLHEFFRQSDVYFLATYAQTVNVIGAIKTTKTAAAMETTGLALALYRKQFGTIPLKLTSPTGPLDVSAALTSDQTRLTLGVVNPTPDVQIIKLSTSGLALSGTGAERHSFGGTDPEAFNDPGHALKFAIAPQRVEDVTSLPVGPYSVSVFVLPVRR